MSDGRLSYVLVTPARNEEAFIELTIRSVVGQTARPARWLIVSDGSTDRTDEIVRQYAAAHSWIELFRRPERETRDFAGKANCFNAGYSRLQQLPHDLVGSLDADLSFEPAYFEFLLEKFATLPKLGVAGTPFVEGAVSYDYRFTSIEHVSGACQLFRRKCFEDIGGYVPIKGGGIDWVAVTTARLKGWQTRTFPEKVCQHHRPMGTATVGNFRALYNLGRQDYYLGGHPLWQVFRSCFQTTRRPYLIGGLCLFAGFFGALLSGAKKSVSPELMRFHRTEQMRRLRRHFGADDKK
jgi:glycosyltransferase involved in cell wall biosynthesis